MPYKIKIKLSQRKSSAYRTKIIHASIRYPYDKRERENIVAKTLCFISFALRVVKGIAAQTIKPLKKGNATY